MRKLAPYIIGILLVIGMAACVPFLLNVDRYRPQIASYLSERVHHKVVIGKLSNGFFPPTLLFHDVSVSNQAGDTPVIQIENISVPLNLGALFTFKVVPASIVGTGWTTTLHRAADGSWGLDEWLPATGDLPHQAGWALDSFTLHGGEVHAIDSVVPEPELVLRNVDLQLKPATGDLSSSGTATLDPASFNFAFKGTVHLGSAPDYAGLLQLSDGSRQWTIDCTDKADRFDAHGQSAEWRWDNALPLLRFYTRWPAANKTTSSVTLQQWDLQFSANAASTTFKQTATVAGGQTELSGALQGTPAGRVADADIAFKGVQAKDMEAALWGTSHWEGSATGIGHVQVVLSSQPWSNLEAKDGYFELTGGKYHAPDSLAKTLSKAHTMRYFQKKFPDFLTQGLAFQKVSSHLQAHMGTLFFNDGFCNLGDVQIGLVGKAEPAKSGLDAFLRMQIHEHNPQLIKEISSGYLFSNGSHTQIQPIYGHLQGTWESWSLRAVRSSKIPAATASKLKRAVLGK